MPNATNAFYIAGKQAAFEKLGLSRWAKYLREAGPEARHTAVQELSRLHGTRPPMRASPTDYAGASGDQRIETLIKAYRRRGAAQIPEFAPRLSPTWRAAMSDIRAGRMTPLETGLSDVQAKKILQYGPSTPIGGPLTENMPAVVKDPQRYNILTNNPRGPEAERMRSGLYASSADTPRTYEYAEQAARRGGQPAALQFQLPESIAKIQHESEYQIPRDIFMRWARKPQIVPLT